MTTGGADQPSQPMSAASHLAQLDPSRGLVRQLVRLPIILYRRRLGWLLGRRLLLLTTVGRRTGLPRQVVLEVLHYDPQSGVSFVASAWGRHAQWFRNVLATPRATVQVGRRVFSAEIVCLSETPGEQQLRAYATRHRWSYRLFIGPLLLGHRPCGTDAEFAALARAVPILSVRPTS